MPIDIETSAYVEDFIVGGVKWERLQWVSI